MAKSRAQLINSIFTPPSSWNIPGEWFWWFWLFFIHDENTPKTGKCRQLMILWSIKKDEQISCNSLNIQFPIQLEKTGDMRWKLNGAVAAWYFDGELMHDDFVLETSCMELDGQKLSLSAPGNTPSSFVLGGDEYVTRIKSKTGSGSLDSHEFEFRARQVDMHMAVGPVHGKAAYPLGMEVEGTRIERLDLSGFEIHEGKKSLINGTAYFQKILVAAPVPQWYWGMYHFADGSYLTFMVPYLGRAMLCDNMFSDVKLRRPTLPIGQDFAFYHAPTGRVFNAKTITISPIRENGRLWSHEISAKGDGFEVNAFAKAYACSTWKFVKKIGALPIRSTFKYNEYPAVLEKLILQTKEGDKIELENGWGNMENAWGFIL